MLNSTIILIERIHVRWHKGNAFIGNNGHVWGKGNNLGNAHVLVSAFANLNKGRIIYNGCFLQVYWKHFFENDGICCPLRWLQWKFYHASYLNPWTSSWNLVDEFADFVKAYFMKLTWWLYLFDDMVYDIATTLSYCSMHVLTDREGTKCPKRPYWGEDRINGRKPMSLIVLTWYWSSHLVCTKTTK